MHNQTILYLIHIPVWIIAIFVSYFFSLDEPIGSNSIDLWFSTAIFSFYLLLSFYTFYAFLVPKYLEKRKNMQFWAFALIFVLLIMPFVELLLIHLADIAALHPPEYLSLKGFHVWLGSVIGTAFCAILGSLYRFSIDWFNNLNLRQEIKNIHLKSELQLIKSRLNPHFLFNTLNNIDTLIETEPSKASEILSKLSDLLRYVVYESQEEQISIKDEIKNITKYIDLEKIRISNPDAVSFESYVDKNFMLAPMIFMPFIENAFKHSNLNQENQKIEISIKNSDNNLIFRCLNTVSQNNKPTNSKGIGLELIKKRLDLIYAERYKLQIEHKSNYYKVNLIISQAKAKKL